MSARSDGRNRHQWIVLAVSRFDRDPWIWHGRQRRAPYDHGDQCGTSAHQVDVASGINNAVSSVANLLAVAILGGVAVATLDHALNQRLQGTALCEPAKYAIEAARGQLVIQPALGSIQGADRAIAELILKGALAESVRSVLFVAALLALGASAAGSLIPRSADIERQQ